MSTETFYMVWNPVGRAPTFKHATYQLAKVEAERLAREHSGYYFYVLRAVSCTKRVEVQTEMLTEPTEPDHIPF